MFPETIHLQYIRYPKVGKESCLFKVGAKVSCSMTEDSKDAFSLVGKGCSRKDQPLLSLKIWTHAKPQVVTLYLVVIISHSMI